MGQWLNLVKRPAGRGETSGSKRTFYKAAPNGGHEAHQALERRGHESTDWSIFFLLVQRGYNFTFNR